MAASPLYLSEHSGTSVPLEGHVELMEDPSGQLDANEAGLRPADTETGFSPATHARLHPGYSRSAWWLRLDVQSRAAAPTSWRLAMASPRFRHADFYLEGEQGTRISAAASRSRTPSLAFTLQPGEHARILVRVQSDLALQLDLKLYTTAGLRQREAAANLGNGLLLGGLTIMALYGLLLGAFSRQSVFVLQGLCCLGIAAYEAVFRGYARVYLWPHTAEFALRASPLIAAAGLLLMMAYLWQLLGKAGIALPWPRVFAVLAAWHAFSAVLALAGDIQVAAQCVGYGALLQFTALLAAGVKLRHELGRWKLPVIPALFLFLLVTVQRLLEQNGLFHLESPGSLPNPLLELLILATVQTIFVVWVNDIRRERHAQREALAQAREEEKSRLQVEVTRRIHELDRALRDAEKIHQEQHRTLAYISHDLRAPLATIIGYARLLRPQLDRVAGAAVRAIERNAAHQLTLIGELLEYAKGELNALHIDARPLDLKALLDEIAEYAPGISAQQGNRFVYESPAHLPPNLLLDRQRLRQVLLNLLSHASQSRRGGTVRLRIDVEPDDAHWLLRFEVAAVGTACGEAAQVEPWLETGEGGGLGLFIAHRVVRKMGGELRQAETDAATALAFKLQAPR